MDFSDGIIFSFYSFCFLIVCVRLFRVNFHLFLVGFILFEVHFHFHFHFMVGFLKVVRVFLRLVMRIGFRWVRAEFQLWIFMNFQKAVKLAEGIIIVKFIVFVTIIMFEQLFRCLRFSLSLRQVELAIK